MQDPLVLFTRVLLHAVTWAVLCGVALAGPDGDQLPDLRPGGGQVPRDRSEDLFHAAPGGEAEARSDRRNVLSWVAPNLVHKPLYFDDQPLERFGQTARPGLQPAVSAVRFFAGYAVLPWNALAGGPHRCVSTMSRCRPGSRTAAVRQKVASPRP